MKLFHIVLVSLLIFIVTANPAIADRKSGKQHNETHYFDYAQVTHVDPIFKLIESNTPKCKESEQVPHRPNQQKVPSQNKDDYASKRQSHEQRLQSKRTQELDRKSKCIEPKPKKQIVGYKFRYNYKGHTFQTKSVERPGRRIKVKVRVEPMTK